MAAQSMRGDVTMGARDQGPAEPGSGSAEPRMGGAAGTGRPSGR